MSSNFNKLLTLLRNCQLLMNNDSLDKIYDFNIDEVNDMGISKLSLIMITIRIRNEKLKITPGLFQLVFHAKRARQIRRQSVVIQSDLCEIECGLKFFAI